MQNADKLVKCLEQGCFQPKNSQESEISVLCWGLAHAHRDLLITVQSAQEQEQISGSTDKAAAAPENHPVPGSVTSVWIKRQARKSAHLEKGEDKPRSSGQQEEEPEVVT